MLCKRCVKVRFVKRLACCKSTVPAGDDKLYVNKSIGNSISKVLRPRLSGYDRDYRAEHSTFTVLGSNFICDQGQGYRSRRMGMDNRPVGGFQVDSPVDTVLTGSLRRNCSFQQDKDRFSTNIEIGTCPLDKKTGFFMKYADVPEITSYKVLRKEPLPNPFEFIGIHKMSLCIRIIL